MKNPDDRCDCGALLANGRCTKCARAYEFDEPCERHKEVEVTTLQLGDRIELFDEPYGWGTVTAIWDDEVEITRPYLHTSDCSYSAWRHGETTGSRLVSYTGLETMKLSRSSTAKCKIAFRTTVPK